MSLDGPFGEWLSEQANAPFWLFGIVFSRTGQLAAASVAASWAFAVRSPTARRDLVGSIRAASSGWALLLVAGTIVPNAKAVGILLGAMQGVWLLPVRALVFTTLVASGGLIGWLVPPRCRCRSTLVAHLLSWLYAAVCVNQAASELLGRWGSETEPFVFNPEWWVK